jgi:hypothetical protein
MFLQAWNGKINGKCVNRNTLNETDLWETEKGSA